jgi:hypothetical protein
LKYLKERMVPTTGVELLWGLATDYKSV